MKTLSPLHKFATNDNCILHIKKTAHRDLTQSIGGGQPSNTWSVWNITTDEM